MEHATFKRAILLRSRAPAFYCRHGLCNLGQLYFCPDVYVGQ